MIKLNKRIGLHPGKQIDGLACNTNLLELQAKLYNALKLNKSEKVIKQIHNEILTSFACRALAVRKVTADSSGKTSGVDGVLGIRDEQKGAAIRWLKDLNGDSYECEPIKRVSIPKSNSNEMRQLGIPTIKDRTAQTLGNFILDVHQENNADSRSFGFRIGRNAKQALTYIHKNTSGTQQKRLILCVDIKKASNKVLRNGVIDNTPINKNVVKTGLKAGVLNNGKYDKTTEGLLQGGPISPTIFNMVMNGIESEILKTKYCSPVRYADDILVLARTTEQLNIALEAIKKFLIPRGLIINESKTVIAKIEDGFNYLGYNIREYEDESRQGKKGYGDKKGIVIVKPGLETVKSIKQKIKAITIKYAKCSAAVLIMKLNPILRGWANYFNAGGGGTHAKNKLGHYIGIVLNQWVRKKHRKFKGGRRSLLNKYFTRIQRRKTYYNRGTFFGMNLGKQVLLVDVQEVLVNNENTLKFNESINPYNPDEYDYFKRRNRSSVIKNIELNKQKLSLLKKQDGLCAICTGKINNTEKVEIDHIIAKKDGGTDKPKNLRLIHITCHQQKTAVERRIRAIKRTREKEHNTQKTILAFA